MNLKVEDIQKHDKLVREKFPTCRMLKSGSRLTWWDGYRIVATLETIKGSVIFKFAEK